MAGITKGMTTKGMATKGMATKDMATNNKGMVKAKGTLNIDGGPARM